MLPDGGNPEERSQLVEIRERYSVVPDGPATLDLDAIGSIEICGAQDFTAATAGELLGQLAALHSPDHLAITAILAETAGHFDWMKWLPHARRPALAPATDESSASALASGLLDRLSAGRRPGQRVVVAVEDGVLAAADLTDLIERGRQAGVFVLAMTPTGAPPLPAGAQLTIDQGERVATLRVGSDQRRKVVLRNDPTVGCSGNWPDTWRRWSMPGSRPRRNRSTRRRSRWRRIARVRSCRHCWVRWHPGSTPRRCWADGIDRTSVSVLRSGPGPTGRSPSTSRPTR